MNEEEGLDNTRIRHEDACLKSFLFFFDEDVFLYYMPSSNDIF